jgi:hypothetical protein
VTVAPFSSFPVTLVSAERLISNFSPLFFPFSWVTTILVSVTSTTGPVTW